VPFFIRAGKALPTRVTEVRLVFRRPPKIRFIGGANHGQPNQIVLRIDPVSGLRIELISQGAQRGWRQVHLDMLFEEALGQPLEPYERLLRDAIQADDHLFSREDTLEETWRVVQPLLDNPPPVHKYAQGSWGPQEADAVIRGYSDWHDPWLPASSDSHNGGHDASH
jgi:glucose-6-phosphate 1-dehydrogenase